MIRQRLYIQLCLIFVAGLMAFAVITILIWRATGHVEYEEELFDKTTSLTMLLLPPADADRSDQLAAMGEVGEALDFDITLWDENGDLIGARGDVAEFPTDLRSDIWVPSKGQAEWSTRLPDNRVVVINLDRMPVPNPALKVVLALLLLAILVAAISYPFIRHITRRVERLQDQVVRIGAGDLEARVDVVGCDEIAQLAQSFNRSAEQIEALVESQRLLLANASHELRTPLSRIRLGIEILQKSDDPKRRHALQSDIRELDKLIHEIILMTRLDTGTHVEEFENVDFLALVAEECAHYPDCDLDGTGADVVGDRRMLQHMIRNLLDNAVVHGGSPVAVVVRQNAQETILEIRDSGSGIPESERDKVFQPFYRAADKQNVSGHGLGLPLVGRIADLHNGAIQIEDTPVSLVRLTLPHTTGADC